MHAMCMHRACCGRHPHADSTGAKLPRCQGRATRDMCSGAHQLQGGVSTLRWAGWTLSRAGASNDLAG